MFYSFPLCNNYIVLRFPASVVFPVVVTNTIIAYFPVLLTIRHKHATRPTEMPLNHKAANLVIICAVLDCKYRYIQREVTENAKVPAKPLKTNNYS